MNAPVFEGLTVEGSVNTADAKLPDNVQSSIRRGYPQIWPTAVNGHRVVIVGGATIHHRRLRQVGCRQNRSPLVTRAPGQIICR